MITSPAVTLALGVPTTIVDPLSNGGNQPTAVQIQNASGFVINVAVDGDVLTIQSFTAQTVATAGNGSSVVITPISAGEAVATSLIAVWLLAGEQPPMADGPLTAQAIAAAISGQVQTTGLVDVLVQDAAPPATGKTYTFTAENSYQSLGVNVTGTVSGIVTIIVNNATNPFFFDYLVEPLANPVFPLLFTIGRVFQFACKVGDTISVTVSAPSGGLTNITIVGLGGCYVEQIKQLPGQAIDVHEVGGGTTATDTTLANGASVVLIAAPTTPLAFVNRLHSIAAFNSLGGPVASGGVSVLIGATYVAFCGVTSQLLGGLLAASAVTIINWTGAAAAVTICYDTVPTPVSQ